MLQRAEPIDPGPRAVRYGAAAKREHPFAGKTLEHRADDPSARTLERDDADVVGDVGAPAGRSRDRRQNEPSVVCLALGHEPRRRDSLRPEVRDEARRLVDVEQPRTRPPGPRECVVEADRSRQHEAPSAASHGREDEWQRPDQRRGDPGFE